MAQRASLYVRLSREAGETNLSLEGMLEDCRRLCAERGFEVVAEHVDDGISGAVRDRAEFLAWLHDGSSGLADVLVTAHPDRLTREGVNAAAMVLDVVEGKDPSSGKVIRGPVRLMGTDGLDSAEGDSFRWRFVIAAEVARSERSRIAARAAASHRRLRAAGRWPGGVVPYGYRAVTHPDGVGKALEVDPAEAVVVRRMVDEVLAGDSVYTVTKRLNADGIPTRRGGPWTPTVVQRVLRGDALLGRVKHRGSLLADEETGLPLVQWEPLVTVDESARLRARTEWTSRGLAGVPRPKRAVRLLSGLLSCPSCGSSLVVRKRPVRDVYGCSLRARGGSCERGIVVECERVEQAVEDRFLDAFGVFRVVEQVVTSPEPEELALVEATLADVARQMTEPGADVPALVERLTRLRAERERLEALPREPEARLVDTGKTFAETWAVSDVARRRALLVSAGAEIDVAHAARRGHWDASRVKVRLPGVTDE